LWACHSHVSPSVADCSLIPESYDDDQPEEQRQINRSANWGPRHQEAFWHWLWHRVFEPSVLRRCWLGGRKGIRPVKKLSGAGMVICLEQGADLHMSQLMPMPLTVSCFSKIQIDFTFLVPAYPGSPGQRAVKRLCVCVWHGVLRYSPVVNLCNMFYTMRKCTECVIYCSCWFDQTSPYYMGPQPPPATGFGMQPPTSLIRLQRNRSWDVSFSLSTNSVEPSTFSLTKILYCFCQRPLPVVYCSGLWGGNCYVNLGKRMGWSLETGKLFSTLFLQLSSMCITF